MGKTARWFRGLLGRTKKESCVPPDSKPSEKKKKWSFVRSFRDKETPTPTTHASATIDERRGSYRERPSSSSAASVTTTSASYRDCGGGGGVNGADSNKHAIAVAAATAAVAEAAVAAAQAAAAVVKLTSNSGRCASAYVSSSSATSGVRREDWAALQIQSAFRGYLARRALRALKGLVKLQALVRGHIERKKTADTLRCMQALARVQSRARGGRAHVSEPRYPNHKHSLSHHSGPVTPEKYERTTRSNSTRHDRPSMLKRNSSNRNSRNTVDLDRMQVGLNWLDRWMNESSWDQGTENDDKSDKILEVDPGKPHFKHRNALLSTNYTLVSDRKSHSFATHDSPSRDSTTAQLSDPSTSSGEVQSKSRKKLPKDVEDAAFRTADNSPAFHSASSRPGSARRGPFTPAKSECSRSILSGYSDHPNYMANTESFKAKVRSQSAPRQRLEFEKSSSTKRYTIHGFGEVRSSAPALHTNFTNKAYPGSGRLDRLGMPVRM